MRESVGFTFLFNFFATFLVILIFVLISIMNYMKAYKVNSRIASIIEKYNGYNVEAKKEISIALSSMGYRSSTENSCASSANVNKYGTNISTGINNYNFCLYKHDDKGGAHGSLDLNHGETFKVGILTYIYFDIPIINSLVKIPVYSTTGNMYAFKVK